MPAAAHAIQPPGIMRLLGAPDGNVLLHNFDGRLALSTAIPVRNPGSENNGRPAGRSC